MNKIPWPEWWAELLSIAHPNGHRPGQPETWKQFNWAKGQTPQEAYDGEYDMWRNY